MKNLVLAFMILLTACQSYTPAIKKDINNSIIVNSENSAIIDKAIEFLTTYDFNIDNINKSDGYIFASGDLKKLTGYYLDGTWKTKLSIADCGACIMFSPIPPAIAKVNIFIINKKLTFKLMFTEYAQEPQCSAFECFSNGVFEQMFFDYIQNENHATPPSK